MTPSPRRTCAASMALAAALTAGACGTDDPAGNGETGAVVTAPENVETESGRSTAESESSPLRTPQEQRFLDELSVFGFPTDMTASTTVEVGVGICQSIAHGADDDTILDRIRPLTSAIAAQDQERDSAEVGRGFVDASRTHLCD